jgi:hypothetical protein
MNFMIANECPSEGGAYIDEQTKARVKAAHQFIINGSTSAQSWAENSLEGGKRRHT